MFRSALAPGETVGVVGESGSGKSTLARCMALLERPDAGRVMLAGEDLTALPRAELRRRRRQIQTIFQDPFASLNPTLRVGDALAEVLRFHGRVARDRVQARVRELLDQVGLPSSAARRYPRDFSGGQRQRICIARALAAEPEVLIADEPVSALDVSVQAQVLNLLAGFARGARLAIVFIGHDLVLVDYFAPRIELGPTRSARVRWMLLETGTSVPFGGQQRRGLSSAELRSIDPLGKLPAAIIEGTPLFESGPS